MQKTVPLFSIVTISKNNLRGLQKTYNSLAAQSYKDYEWIVVDGNSGDGSANFLKNETTRIQEKSIFIEDDNGIYEAMNKGLALAKGKYLWFMNAGDVFADTATLEIVAAHLEKEPDFLYGDSLDGVPPSLKLARRYKYLPWGMFTHHQAMVYRRKVVSDHNLRYSVLYDIAGDYDFTARFLRKAKKVVYLPKPICVFEEGGISRRQAATGRREQYEIRESLGIVGLYANVWIYCIQTASWQFRAYCPWVYRKIKSLKYLKIKQNKYSL